MLVPLGLNVLKKYESIISEGNFTTQQADYLGIELASRMFTPSTQSSIEQLKDATEENSCR